MTEYNWQRLFRAPGGHTYFRDTITGDIALADDSGPTPDTTDDGVCWVDMDRPVIAAGTGFYVPIICRMSKTTTGATPYEAVKVCTEFKLKLSVDGKLFSMDRSKDGKSAGCGEDKQAHG